MNLRIDFFEAMSSIKLWEDKILGKLPFKTILTICVIVILWQLVMTKSTLSSIESDVSSLEWDVHRIKSDVSSIESDVSSIESDVSSIKRRLPY